MKTPIKLIILTLLCSFSSQLLAIPGPANPMGQPAPSQPGATGTTGAPAVGDPMGDLFTKISAFITELATAADENIVALRSAHDLSGVLPQRTPQIPNVAMQSLIQDEISGNEQQALDELKRQSPQVAQLVLDAYNVLVYPYTSPLIMVGNLHRTHPNLANYLDDNSKSMSSLLQQNNLNKEVIAIRTLLKSTSTLPDCQKTLGQNFQKDKNSAGRGSSKEPNAGTCTPKGAREMLAELKRAARDLKDFVPDESGSKPHPASTAIKAIKEIDTGDDDTSRQTLDAIDQALGHTDTLINWAKADIMRKVSAYISGASTTALKPFTIDSLLEPPAYNAVSAEQAERGICLPTNRSGSQTAMAYINLLKGSTMPPPINPPQIPIGEKDMLLGGKYVSIEILREQAEKKYQKELIAHLRRLSEGKKSEAPVKEDVDNKIAEVLRARSNIANKIKPMQAAYTQVAQSFVASRNLALSNLMKSYDDRNQTLAVQVGDKKQCYTPASIQQHMANWRLKPSTDPKQDWHTRVAAATPVNVARQQAFLLAEIRQQLYLNHQLLERMLATLSANQMQSLQAQQKDLANAKLSIDSMVHNYIEGTVDSGDASEQAAGAVAGNTPPAPGVE